MQRPARKNGFNSDAFWSSCRGRFLSRPEVGPWVRDWGGGRLPPCAPRRGLCMQQDQLFTAAGPCIGAAGIRGQLAPLPWARLEQEEGDREQPRKGLTHGFKPQGLPGSATLVATTKRRRVGELWCGQASQHHHKSWGNARRPSPSERAGVMLQSLPALRGCLETGVTRLMHVSVFIAFLTSF